MLLEFCFVILCLCAVFIFLSIWGSNFEFCGRDLLLGQPTPRMPNKIHSVFSAILLPKRDLLFEVIAQSELSEFCAFYKSGEKMLSCLMQ